MVSPDRQRTLLVYRNARPDDDHLGKYNDHHLYEVEAEGDITVQEDEIESFTWWDTQADTPVAPHVREILERLNQSAMATEATKMQGEGQ